MIKANELRIGNLINIKNKASGLEYKEEYITPSLIMDLHTNGDNSSFIYTPIEITEELLLKYGFKLNRNCSTFCFIDIKEEITIWFDKELSEVSIDIANGCQYIDCKSFHQLQNLYFSLTSEELVLSEA